MYIKYVYIKASRGVNDFGKAPIWIWGQNPIIWRFGPFSEAYPEIYGTEPTNFPFHEKFRRHRQVALGDRQVPLGLLWCVHFLSWEFRAHWDLHLCAFLRRARPTFQGLGSLHGAESSVLNGKLPGSWILFIELFTHIQNCCNCYTVAFQEIETTVLTQLCF